MFNCLKPVALAGVLIAAGFTAQAQDASTVVATVNGKEISLGHMIDAYAKLPDQYRTLPDDVLWQGILDQLVQQSLLAETGDADNNKRIVIALENEERQLRASAAINTISTAALTDEALRAAYEAGFADGGGVEYNAAHILVETEEAAADLAAQARDGADFGGLAREHSTGPSGPNGGDLGWFGEGMMVAPFEEAVKQLKVGDVSDPVQTQFGWHVIKLNENRAKEAPSFEEVRGQLEAQVQAEAVEGQLSELMDKAEVTRTDATEIDPSLIKSQDLLD